VLYFARRGVSEMTAISAFLHHDKTSTRVRLKTLSKQNRFSGREQKSFRLTTS